MGLEVRCGAGVAGQELKARRKVWNLLSLGTLLLPTFSCPQLRTQPHPLRLVLHDTLTPTQQPPTTNHQPQPSKQVRLHFPSCLSPSTRGPPPDDIYAGTNRNKALLLRRVLLPIKLVLTNSLNSIPLLLMAIDLSVLLEALSTDPFLPKKNRTLTCSPTPKLPHQPSPLRRPPSDRHNGPA